jgi:transcriptional regulator with XRE-family HTH domain
MSVEELAHGSGNTPEFIEGLLNGDPGELTLGNLEAIADKLGVHFTDLLKLAD